MQWPHIKQTAATVELVTHTRAKTCTIICISVSIHTFVNISQRHLQWSRSNQSKVHSWACQKFSWVRSRVEGGGQDGSASLVVQGWWLPRGWRQSRQSSATSVCYAQGEEDPAVATCMHTCAHVRMHMHTHTHAHAHTHTCTCTHTRMHMHTHTHAHAHTHTSPDSPPKWWNIKLVRQSWKHLQTQVEWAHALTARLA